MDLAQQFPLSVPPSGEGLRADQYLAQNFPEISRSRWARVLELGLICVAAKAIGAAQRLHAGQVLECNDSRSLRKVLEPGPGIQEVLNDEAGTLTFVGPEPAILLEDEFVLVVNKPVGLSVHPGSGEGLETTLVGWLLASGRLKSNSKESLISWNQEVLEEQRPGIVHRLDKGTSGALIIAKDPTSHGILSQQFASREAGRLYWALVKGRIETLMSSRPKKLDELLLKRPCPVAYRVSESKVHSLATYLSRDAVHRTRFRVSPSEEGKKAITHFSEVSHSAGFSLLEVKLETGRTHQIRIHLAFLDFPIVGDSTYGGIPFRRMMLHAHRLRFRHPKTNDVIEIEAPWPTEDESWLEAQGLRLSSVLQERLLHNS